MKRLWLLISLVAFIFVGMGVSINGELEKALLEKLSADPTGSAAVEGRIYYNTTEKKAKLNNGAGFVGLGSGAGGGGGINILANADVNWDFENGDDGNWTESGTSTFTADDTEADVFLDTYSGLWNAGASGEYLTGTAVAIPNALNSGTVVCLLEFYYKGGDENIDFYAYDGSAAVAGSTETLSASTEWIRAYSIFTCPSSGTLTLRLESTADAAAIYIDNVHIGTKDIISMPDPRWPSYDESEVSITSAQSGWGSAVGNFVPYQDTAGGWRLKFNLYGTFTATGVSTLAVSITGITTVSFDQAISGLVSGSISEVTSTKGSVIVASGNTCYWEGTSSATPSSVRFSGDIALASKPTWATKSAPDLYLSGAVNTEQVVAIYTTDNGDTITNDTYEIVCYENKIKDTHDAVTFTNFATQDWKFTAPTSGYYTVSASVILNMSAGAWNGTSEYFGLVLYKNGVQDTYLRRLIPPSSSQYPNPNGSSTVYLEEGDYIQIKVRQDSGSDNPLYNVAVYNYVSIVKSPSPQDVANMIVGFNLATEDRAGLVPSYKYEELDISSSGDFSAAQPVLRIAKVGSLVTLVFDNLAFSPTGDTPESAAGFIPSIYRPEHGIQNTYICASGGNLAAKVESDGTLGFIFTEPDGTAYSRSSTVQGSISWVVDE